MGCFQPTANVVFFTEVKWAFGSIHNYLIKYLYQAGIDSALLDFNQDHSQQSMDNINNHCDWFVTNYPSLLIQKYNIPVEKIAFVAHAQWDILFAWRLLGGDFFNQVGKFSVISRDLYSRLPAMGISSIPDITTVGIAFDRFYHKPSNQLQKVGYAAAFQGLNYFGEEIKRGRLVQESCDQASLPFIPCEAVHFLGMPEYYQSVDAVISSSTEEGGGLPMMEAAAAGRLVIGTPVGYFAENSALGHYGGVRVSIDERAFVDEVTFLLKHYAKDTESYTSECHRIQEYARETYDWKYHINSWVNFLSK